MYLNFNCRLSNFVSVLQEEQGTFLLHTSCNFDSQITLKNGILINIVSISVFWFWVLGRSLSAFLASFQIFDVPVKLFNAIQTSSSVLDRLLQIPQPLVSVCFQRVSIFSGSNRDGPRAKICVVLRLCNQ